MKTQPVPLNTPMFDAQGGVWAFQRTGKRTKPYQLITPRPVEETTGQYPCRRTVKRVCHEWRTPEWLPECREMTAPEALELLLRWDLHILPVGRDNEAAYSLLLAEADRLQLPRNYRTDLTTHDRTELLLPNATQDFVWVLGQNGTHLIRLDRPGSPTDLISALKHHGDREQHWYHVAGGNLREITAAQAAELGQAALSRQQQKTDHKNSCYAN